MPNIHITQQFTGAVNEAITVTSSQVLINKLIELAKLRRTPPVVSLHYFATAEKKGYYLNIENTNNDQLVFLSTHSLNWLELSTRWIAVVTPTVDGVELILHPLGTVFSKLSESIPLARNYRGDFGVIGNGAKKN